MITRELTWAEIEREFGPLVEISPALDGGWDMLAIEAARRANLLWTRTDPGLVSTGFHFVNRECYFRASVPYADGQDIVEVDPAIVECVECGGSAWASPDALCDECRGVQP